MKRAVAIRHVAFEDLGTLAGLLEARGYTVTTLDAGIDDLEAIPPEEADLLVVLGGPISVNDGADFPFLSHELRLLERRMAADRPTLGVCLGAQLMARALGARVWAGPEKEILWAPITLTPDGLRHPLRHLGEGDGVVLHWHGETFDLPAGATLLASTPKYRNQAFSYGRRALGLQFHPEVSGRGLERWLIGHAGEIAHAPGVSVAALRRGAARSAAACEARAARFLGAWLDACEANQHAFLVESA